MFLSLGTVRLSVTVQMNVPYGIHMHGQCCPEQVNAGHGQLVILWEQNGFHIAPLGLVQELLGVVRLSGKCEVCGVISKCVSAKQMNPGFGFVVFFLN